MSLWQANALPLSVVMLLIVSDGRCHHGYDGPYKRLDVLSLRQFPHEQIVFASPYTDADEPSAVFPDDGIHFPVSASGYCMPAGRVHLSLLCP